MILKEFGAGFLRGKRDDVRFETEPGQQMKVDWVSSGKSRRSSASSLRLRLDMPVADSLSTSPTLRSTSPILRMGNLVQACAAAFVRC
jgi:hypothetical protein